MNQTFFLGLMLALLPLCACQQTSQQRGVGQNPRNPIASEAKNREAAVKRLSKLTQFEVSGKLAFKHEEKGGNAKFSWEQQGNNYTFYLYNPFGGEEARLVYHQQQPRLKFPKEGWITGPELTDLFRAHLGWTLPFKYMGAWIKGMPAPGVAHEFRTTASGYQFQQGAWLVDCERLEYYRGFIVPQKITFRNREDHSVLKLSLHWEN